MNNSKSALVMNNNQHRAISVALSVLDEVLCAVDLWAGGYEARGCLLYTSPSPRDS